MSESGEYKRMMRSRQHDRDNNPPPHGFPLDEIRKVGAKYINEDNPDALWAPAVAKRRKA